MKIVVSIVFLFLYSLFMFFNCAPLTEEGNFKDPSISIMSSTTPQDSSSTKTDKDSSNDNSEEESADEKEDEEADEEEKEEEKEKDDDSKKAPVGEEFPSGPETPETGDPPITRKLY